MTAPEQPPEDEDSSSLIPELLAAYSAYLVYRAARGQLETDWSAVVIALGLPALLAIKFARIAMRALTNQRQSAGQAGVELWQYVQVGIYAGQQAGYQRLAEAFIWADSHTNGEHSTRDESDGSGLIPTAEDPPDILAQVIANAITNAAVLAAAEMAGWKYKTWVSHRDDRVRHTHRVLNGRKVLLAEPFVSPSGASLQHPGDPTAPIEEVARCRCGIRTSRR